MPEQTQTLSPAALRHSIRRAVYLVRSIDSEDAELTSNQISLLSMVRESSPTMTEIARNQGVRVPTATQNVARLVDAGLLRRDRDSADARVVRITLTDLGGSRLDAAEDQRNAAVGALLDQLPADDRARLAAALPVLDRLADLRSEAGQRP